MPIPSYQTIMLPFLKFLSDGKEHQINEIEGFIESFFKLTDEERKKLLPSGKQIIIRNRVGWARTYLKKAGLIESPKRGSFKISQRGIDVLKEKLTEINVEFLERFPEFIEFQTISKHDHEESKAQKTLVDSLDPKELLENAYHKLKDEVAYELLREVKKTSPTFFENIVVELLVKMGYGGSREERWKSYRAKRR